METLVYLAVGAVVLFVAYKMVTRKKKPKASGGSGGGGGGNGPDVPTQAQ